MQMSRSIIYPTIFAQQLTGHCRSSCVFLSGFCITCVCCMYPLKSTLSLFLQLLGLGLPVRSDLMLVMKLWDNPFFCLDPLLTGIYFYNLHPIYKVDVLGTVVYKREREDFFCYGGNCAVPMSATKSVFLCRFFPYTSMSCMCLCNSQLCWTIK